MQRGRLAAWLMRAPDDACVLELRYENLNGVQTVSTWKRSELSNADAADQVLGAAEDHTEGLRTACRFEVCWLNEAGKVLRTQGMRCEPTEEAPEPMVGAGDPPPEDRNAAGIVAQLMRHVENRERMLNIAIGTNLQMMVAQVKEARSEAAQLRDENRQLRQLLKEREDDDESAAEMVEAQARADAVDKVAEAVVTHIVPLAAARLREGLQ